MGYIHRYGTAVHDEFDHYLASQRCGACGSEYFVDDFPRLLCRNGHAATLGFTYREG